MKIVLFNKTIISGGIEKCIENLLDNLDNVGIHSLIEAMPATSTSKQRKNSPELLFCPSDEELFKSKLLASKKAHFILTYESGKTVTSPWNASSLDTTSNIRSNIQSRPFWRNKTKEGLIKVEVYVD